MKYIGHAFSWEQGSWLTAGIILLGSSFLALSPMADNLVSSLQILRTSKTRHSGQKSLKHRRNSSIRK